MAIRTPVTSSRGITDPLRLSAAICYDLDFNDLVRPVRRHGGVLAAPSNDWEQYASIHQQAAIWVPVCTRTTLIRATSHGITAIVDPAGRTLAQASTLDGPVMLLVDSLEQLIEEGGTSGLAVGLAVVALALEGGPEPGHPGGLVVGAGSSAAWP